MKNIITVIIIILLGVGLVVFRKLIADAMIESNVRSFGYEMGGGWWPRKISYWMLVLFGLIAIALGFLTLIGVSK